MTPKQIEELKDTYSITKALVDLSDSEVKECFGYSDPWNIPFERYHTELDNVIDALCILLPSCRTSVEVIDFLKALQFGFVYRAKYVADHERTVVAISDECPFSTRQIAEVICESLNEGTDAASSCQ